jgi:uncharacterized protein
MVENRGAGTLGFLLLVVGSGCGGGTGAAGEAVRPNDPTAAEAMGESGQGSAGGKCSNVSEDARPFLADWKTDDRAQLEAAMQDSLAVVSYTCDGIKVLSDCKLPGSNYGFAQVAIKKDDLIIDQSSDLSATIPLSAVSISGEIQRGLKLKLRYALVGRKATQPDAVLKGDLKGKCDGATHFVRAAWVGAFEFGTATEGRAGGSAKVLGAGTEAHSASAKQTTRSEGDLNTCKSDANLADAPQGCNGLVRLQLGPVVEKMAAARDDEGGDDSSGQGGGGKVSDAKNPCSAGFVLGGDGECKKKSGANAYLCDPKNLDECVAQCEKGSAESCHNAGRATTRGATPATFQELGQKAAVFYEKGCNGNYAPSCTASAGHSAMGQNRDVDKARQLYEKGCQLGDANSCSSLGHAAESSYLSPPGKPFQPSPTTAFKYMQQACNLGAGYACANVAKRYIEGKGVMANADAGLKALEKGCQAGSTPTCTTLAEHLATGKGGVKQDPERAIKIYHANCETKNDGTACFGAAEVYRKGAGSVKKDPKNAQKHLEHACSNLKHGKSCAALGSMFAAGDLGDKDAAQAAKYYELGCPSGKNFPNDGCGGLAELYEKGSKPVAKDPEKAALAYVRACQMSDFEKTGVPEKACRKAATLLKKQNKEKELVSTLGRLCFSFQDKKACDDRKKLARAPAPPPGGPPRPPGSKPPPPPGPPGSKPPPPPPPPGKSSG